MAEEPRKEEQQTAAVAASKKSYADKKKKRKRVAVANGVAHIQATYNNTIVTLTDLNGNVLASASAGQCGFRGPKKSTPYAAGIIVRSAMEKLTDVGLKNVNVRISGVGFGREAAIRALAAHGLNIGSIKDVTPVAHNGPRPRKARRV